MGIGSPVSVFTTAAKMDESTTVFRQVSLGYVVNKM